MVNLFSLIFGGNFSQLTKLIALCDKGRAVVVIYLDVNLTLDMISYSIFVSKLEPSGLDILAGLLSLKGSYSTWRSLQAEFFRDLFWQFNVFVIDVKVEAVHTLTKFPADTELGRAIDTLQGRVAT